MNNFTSTRIFTLSLLLSFWGCQKADKLENKSTASSIALNTRTAAVMSYALDPVDEALIVGFVDIQRSGSALIKKINLNSLKEEKSVSHAYYRLLGGINMIATADRGIISHVADLRTGEHILAKFDEAYGYKEGITYAMSNPRTKIRVSNAGPGRIVVGANLGEPFKNFLHFTERDENLNIVNEVVDTNYAAYGALTESGGLMACQNGGYLYSATQYSPPFFSKDVLLEKRDAQFNLEWRSKYATDGDENTRCIIEKDGKFYVFCDGDDADNDFNTKLFVLVYDQNGNLLDNKTISGDALYDRTMEPIVATEDGGFLMTALTSKGMSISSRKGVLYKTDANLNVQKTQYFGGNAAVFNSGLIKAGHDRYFLFYTDNGFGPDGNSYRLEMRFVNGKGEYIKE